MRTQSLRLVLLAILNSIVQFLGVLLWRWPIGNVFLLFWVENVIITIMSIARVAAVPRGGGGELAGKLIASSVLARMAGGEAIATIKVGADKKGGFKYRIH